MMGLTKQQAALFAFIRSELADGRPAPSYGEMAKQLNLASLSGIHRLVKGLEARGLIRRIAGAARSVSVIPQGSKPGTVAVALPEFTYRQAEASAAARGLPVHEWVATLVLEGTKEIGR
jgi:SOS-response transcriptional repressor LexA